MVSLFEKYQMKQVQKEFDRTGLHVSMDWPQRPGQLGLGFLGDYKISSAYSTMFLGSPYEHGVSMLTAAPSVREMPLLIAMRNSCSLDTLVEERAERGLDVIEINLDPECSHRHCVNPLAWMPWEHNSRRAFVENLSKTLIPDIADDYRSNTQKARWLLIALINLYSCLPDLSPTMLDGIFDSQYTTHPTLHGLCHWFMSYGGAPDAESFIRKCAKIVGSPEFEFSAGPNVTLANKCFELQNISSFLDYRSVSRIFNRVITALTPFYDEHARIVEVTSGSDLSSAIFSRYCSYPELAMSPCTVVIRLGEDQSSVQLANFVVEYLLSERLRLRDPVYAGMAPGSRGGGMAAFLDVSMILGENSTVIEQMSCARSKGDIFALFSSSEELKSIADERPDRYESCRAVCGVTVKLNDAERQETRWRCSRDRIRLSGRILKLAEARTAEKIQVLAHGSVLAPIELVQQPIAWDLD